MIIRRVSTRNFGPHTSVDVTLPDAGLVLITGNNGEGKSTLTEAVGHGLWGQTLRDKPCWQQGAKSGVEVTFDDGGFVRRSVSGTKHVLKWNVGDQTSTGYPTRTKSQEALCSAIGSFNVWRNACTFHTRDAARFSSATDSARKRLLEEVLELDIVERAYRRARDEVATARRQATETTHTLALAEQAHAGLVALRGAYSGELEDVPDMFDLRREYDDIVARINDNTAATHEKQAELADIEANLSEVRASLRAAEKRKEHFVGLGDVCPTCEQRVEDKHADLEIASAQEQIVDLKKREAWHASLHELTKGDIDKLVAEGMALLDAKRDNIAKGKEGAAIIERNKARQEKLDGIGSKIADAATEITTCTAANDDAVALVAELEAAASVLSYQGVRAALLTAAVASLQDLSNAWLAKLGLDRLSVRLSSQSETKGGKVADKISLDVDGAGGGYGYGNASTGEQRRIDLALCFALGELASQSRGLSEHSTMFVDELFDGLDAAGMEAAVSMLRDLSADRCVVVITHNPVFIDLLNPTMHIVAAGGTLKEA